MYLTLMQNIQVLEYTRVQALGGTSLKYGIYGGLNRFVPECPKEDKDIMNIYPDLVPYLMTTDLSKLTVLLQGLWIAYYQEQYNQTIDKIMNHVQEKQE